MFDDNGTTFSGHINTDLVDWREKARQEAIEDVAPHDNDSNEGQNPEVIFDDEDHDTDRSEFTTSQALQHLDRLIEFSIDKNQEALLEVTNIVENRKPFCNFNKATYQIFSRSLKLFLFLFILNVHNVP